MICADQELDKRGKVPKSTFFPNLQTIKLQFPDSTFICKNIIKFRHSRTNHTQQDGFNFLEFLTV